MTRIGPIAALKVLILVVGVSDGGAAPASIVWGKYEKVPRSDGIPLRCLKQRRGIQGVDDARWYSFQVFNDCNRWVQAVCDIAYTPNCDYGQDVLNAAHLDAPIEPYGETPAFGHYAPPTDGGRGCFFTRCSEATP